MEQAKCTSCGASQEIEKDQNCGYCGTLMIFKESQDYYEEIISGVFGNFLIMADTALEAEDYGEAINYYNKILETDIKYADAWLGKANGMIYTSKLGDIKMKEALTYWKNSIKFSTNKDAMKLRVGKEINRVTNLFFPNILNHYKEFSNTDNAYGELADRFMTLEAGMKYTCELCPENVEFFRTGKSLCELVISSPSAQASGAQGAAAIGGLIGAFSGNKYDQRRASNAWQEASSQKKVIQQFSDQISSLKQFYVDGLIRLGVEVEPQQQIQGSNKVAIDPSTIDVDEFKSLKNIYWVIIGISVLIMAMAVNGPAGLGGVLTGLFWFLILYFTWLNRRSKKRLGYSFNVVWKVREQIGKK
jgi:hypothetical protein